MKLPPINDFVEWEYRHKILFMKNTQRKNWKDEKS